MSTSDEAAHLLAMARKDLTALGGMNDPNVFADEIYGFHAQQALEKALKAWLAALGIEYPRTHDVRALLALLKERGASVDDLWDLVEYNFFAVQFRYDAYEPLDEPLNRAATHARVAGVIEKVSNIIQATA